MRVCKHLNAHFTQLHCIQLFISIYYSIIYITSSTQSIKVRISFYNKIYQIILYYTVPGSVVSFSYSYNIITLKVYTLRMVFV